MHGQQFCSGMLPVNTQNNALWLGHAQKQHKVAFVDEGVQDHLPVAGIASIACVGGGDDGGGSVTRPSPVSRCDSILARSSVGSSASPCDNGGQAELDMTLTKSLELLPDFLSIPIGEEQPGKAHKGSNAEDFDLCLSLLRNIDIQRVLCDKHADSKIHQMRQIIELLQNKLYETEGLIVSENHDAEGVKAQGVQVQGVQAHSDDQLGDQAEGQWLPAVRHHAAFTNLGMDTDPGEH